jgi:hypothetical protein
VCLGTYVSTETSCTWRMTLWHSGKENHGIEILWERVSGSQQKTWYAHCMSNSTLPLVCKGKTKRRLKRQRSNFIPVANYGFKTRYPIIQTSDHTCLLSGTFGFLRHLNHVSHWRSHCQHTCALVKNLQQSDMFVVKLTMDKTHVFWSKTGSKAKSVLGKSRN